MRRDRKFIEHERQAHLIGEFLKPAGIILNGPHQWDPQIRNERIYDRILRGGTLALGEGYMDGDWDVEDMPGFFARVMRSEADGFVSKRKLLWPIIKANIFNMQDIVRARKVAHEHYDLGNDLYEGFLDRSLSYSCGYWEHASNLDDAQEAKHDLICRKLGLEKGMRVLDIGCGWGGFALFAARKYGVKVVGVTISEAQKKYARDRVKENGLESLIEIRLEDYRHVTDGPYDRIVSIGMFEHVGRKNYGTYMRTVRALLKEDGLFLLQTVAASCTWPAPNPWVDKYIFPNGYLPSVAQIGDAIDGIFMMKDWHTFGHHYTKTILAWHARFEISWPQIKGKYHHLHSGKFYRMWRYYLLSTAGGFMANRIDLWQVVLSPKGRSGHQPARLSKGHHSS